MSVGQLHTIQFDFPDKVSATFQNNEGVCPNTMKYPRFTILKLSN
jgi:hypothetical protein